MRSFKPRCFFKKSLRMSIERTNGPTNQQTNEPTNQRTNGPNAAGACARRSPTTRSPPPAGSSPPHCCPSPARAPVKSCARRGSRTSTSWARGVKARRLVPGLQRWGRPYSRGGRVHSGSRVGLVHIRLIRPRPVRHKRGAQLRYTHTHTCYSHTHARVIVYTIRQSVTA